MKGKYVIFIAGPGSVGRALALILAEYAETVPAFYLGDRHVEQAIDASGWIREGASRHVDIIPFFLPEAGVNAATIEALRNSDILLDCLPGVHAPRMARLALDYGLHYVNLTEYVKETDEIVAMAALARKGFVLQAGLAPGFVNILAHGLFQDFCTRFGVSRASYVGMKTGGLTMHASAPHYYGFTWSPIGVATEYVQDAWGIRDYRKERIPALSEPEIIHIQGIAYEADITSGGAADLPDALSGKVRTLDYKTLRYPGHYHWIKGILSGLPEGGDRIARLQEAMEETVPHVEEDCVVIHACVEGKDRHGSLQKLEKAFRLLPREVGAQRLKAIQIATAAPVAEVARFLLEGEGRGVILQSQLPVQEFMNGRFIQPFFQQDVVPVYEAAMPL